MHPFIDFKELRAKLAFEDVLRHYGVEVKRKGDQHQGYCPLPNHNGKKNSPSFSANLSRGIFQCFGCGAKGNVLEFAAMMEKVNPSDGRAFREIAAKLKERFCPDGKPETKPVTQESELPVVINEPLDFELKGLDPAHPYLPGRGFTMETITQFGLGFCTRGMLKNRIAIPLQDNQSRVIGYAGRVVDDSTINEDNPRYRFPGKREREGKVCEFRKTLFLYNGFRLPAPLVELIVVEGFTSVWWFAQNGFPHVVATMGPDCSDHQAELIVELVGKNGRVWIVSDGDNAGERFAHSLLTKVSPWCFIRWVRLRDGAQATSLNQGQLVSLFS